MIPWLDPLGLCDWNSLHICCQQRTYGESTRGWNRDFWLLFPRFPLFPSQFRPQVIPVGIL
jgi:hypothetical protein